jgi:hypothetical protein
MVCLLKFPVKVGVEESIVNAPLVSLSSAQTTETVRLDLNSFISGVIRGAFTIDSSTPTLTGNFNARPIYYYCINLMRGSIVARNSSTMPLVKRFVSTIFSTFLIYLTKIWR